MTDSKKLREAVKKRGYKYKYIAANLGITPYCLQKKIDNITDFKGKEIVKITYILELTPQQRDEIFFA